MRHWMAEGGPHGRSAADTAPLGNSIATTTRFSSPHRFAWVISGKIPSILGRPVERNE
jgi:hypothetical protein